MKFAALAGILVCIYAAWLIRHLKDWRAPLRTELVTHAQTTLQALALGLLLFVAA